jgi:hypothetical protein
VQLLTTFILVVGTVKYVGEEEEEQVLWLMCAAEYMRWHNQWKNEYCKFKNLILCMDPNKRKLNK